VYGVQRDIEWAFADGQLYLLQCRAMTTSAGAAPPAVAGQVAEVSAASLERVPLLSSLPESDRDAIARLFTERTFAPGETVMKEGADAAAFYLIVSGTATVTVGGAFRRTLGPGEHFGEIALIDGRARTATVTADGELVCQGITLWDFQPLVQRNPTMAWTLLQTMAGLLRQAGAPPTTHEG
jgi:CRP-like cAMP-binding protein